jgi:two-component system sensor histidine kinase ChiS
VPLVLQVSDDEAELGRFAEELAPLGCRFVAVRSATEALDRFSLEGPFTAVLVHARWSDSERAAFVRTLRERVAGGQKLPLLVVLDEATAQRPEELFAAGASEVVQEPFAMLELLERLRSQFAVARLALAAERLVSREFVELLGCGSFAELKLGACVERDMSVLFADLQGFTKASERMTSRQVFGWLNKRFGAVVPALRANGGFVDKFIGDALMALFAQSPKGALRAAIEASHAMRSVDGINRLGIGVHHGPTMIGTLGEKDRFAPTVVSDTVNVAARLESLTRRFGSSALVSEETLNQLDGVERPSTRYLGAFRVKGRDKALRIHELLDAEEAAYAAQKRAAAQILQRVVAFVDRGDLGNAARAAALGASEFPSDSALAFYIIELERVARHEADFDGVIALQEK